MKKRLMFGCLLACTAWAGASGYRVLNQIKVGGEGGWDYATMDSEGRRLYVSHGNHMVVIDPDAGKVVGDIGDTAGVHGVAIARDLNRGFTSNGRANTVTIFDLKTLEKLGEVKTGGNPDAIEYDPSTHRVFTFNGKSNDATAIDAKTGTVLATIPVGGKPEFAANDGRGKIYFNNEDAGEVLELDARDLKITKHFSLKPCEEPSGLALDREHRRVFSVCANKLMTILNPDSGALVATVPIGSGADGAGFDPGTGYAFSSNGQDGTLTVVGQSGGKWTVIDTVPTKRGARTHAVDPKTHKIFLPSAEFGPAPAKTDANPRPRPSLVPGSFEVVVVGR